MPGTDCVSIGFIAFTTTGYGDYSPETPAGRSIFVFWALFGVGTLTILVSGKHPRWRSLESSLTTPYHCLVLQEAGSSRYKSALHSRVFDKAVKKYRKANKQLLDVRHPLSAFHKEHGVFRSPTKPNAQRLREAREQTQHALELLPGDIIRNAKTFRDYIDFFVSGAPGEIEGMAEGGGVDIGIPKVPRDMKKLLDELAEIEDIGERLKSEILQDDDARKVRGLVRRRLSSFADVLPQTLFMLGLERTFPPLSTFTRYQ